MFQNSFAVALGITCFNFTGSPFREQSKAHPVTSLMARCSQKEGTAQDSSLKIQTQIFSFPDNSGTQAFKNGFNRGESSHWEAPCSEDTSRARGQNITGVNRHRQSLLSEWPPRRPVRHEQQRYVVQLPLPASLTPQQRQRRGGDTEEEMAAAVRLASPN